MGLCELGEVHIVNVQLVLVFYCYIIKIIQSIQHPTLPPVKLGEERDVHLLAVHLPQPRLLDRRHWLSGCSPGLRAGEF